jgi:hypothetical protein
MKYAVQTFFDITATGITGHFKPAKVPFRDDAGNSITDQESWNRGRNQQRNWETITQILGLRTQLFRLQTPMVDTTNRAWMFEFETETDHIYGDDADPTRVLTSDADGVPMLVGLDDRLELTPMLATSGPAQNIWFTLISINTSMET